MHRLGTAPKATVAHTEGTDTATALLRRVTGPRGMRTGGQRQTMGSPLPAPSSTPPGQVARMQAMARQQPGTARASTQGMGRLQPARSAALMHMAAAKDRCRSDPVRLTAASPRTCHEGPSCYLHTCALDKCYGKSRLPQEISKCTNRFWSMMFLIK